MLDADDMMDALGTDMIVTVSASDFEKKYISRVSFDAIRAELAAAKALIIEADAQYNTNKKPADFDTASMALVTMAAHGSRALADVAWMGPEIDKLRADLAAMTADRDSEQRWAKYYSDKADLTLNELNLVKAELAQARELLSNSPNFHGEHTAEFIEYVHNWEVARVNFLNPPHKEK